MNLLFLSPRVPHAKVVSGPIIVYHRIRLLAQRGHRIGLIVFADKHERAHLDELREYVDEIAWLPTPRRGPLHRMTGCLLCRYPKPFCACQSAEMRRLVGRVVENASYDVAIAEFSVMGQYLYRNPYLPAIRRVVSVHSCLSQAVKRSLRLRNNRSLRSLSLRIRLNDLNRYEFAMYRSADLVLALTPQEKSVLQQQAPDITVSVIPYGVDIEPYERCRRLRLQTGRTVPQRIIFTGFFRDEQNRDAVMWFMRDTWPLLKRRHPALQCYIVGRGPPSEIRALPRQDANIVVTGEVDDLAPYLAQSDVYVCPVRLGTGFRGRILQAMAAGVVVVSTTLGTEGIPALTGNNIIVADTPHIQAEKISLLLSDSEYRRQIADNAFAMVSRRFSWNRVVAPLESELERLLR